MPALDLYDGPFYRIIRKIFREKGKLGNLDFWILSAKYGLINHDELISNYDQRMTKVTARDISLATRNTLLNIINKTYYQEIMINLGKAYLMAFGNIDDIVQNQTVKYGKGSIGKRNRQLKEWLLSISRDTY